MPERTNNRQEASGASVAFCLGVLDTQKSTRNRSQTPAKCSETLAFLTKIGLLCNFVCLFVVNLRKFNAFGQTNDNLNLKHKLYINKICEYLLVSAFAEPIEIVLLCPTFWWSRAKWMNWKELKIGLLLPFTKMFFCVRSDFWWILCFQSHSAKQTLANWW